jgi:hypothetical protein
MSSDESDDESQEPGKPCYVHRPLWRAEELSPWLRVFDSVHLALTREHGSGHGPHLRIYDHLSPRISRNEKFIARLPVNAYDKRWLERRNNDGISVYPSNVYDFRHDEDVFK